MSTQRRIAVEPDPRGGWVITTGEDRRSKRFDERGDAEATAVAWARSSGGAELLVKDQTGGIDHRRFVEGDE